jgi:O-methyltransferase
MAAVTENAAAALYLNLMEAVLTGVIMEDPPIATPAYKAIVSDVLHGLYGVRAEPDSASLGFNARAREVGLDWPSRAFTMIGRQRLRNFRDSIESAITAGIEGDIVEAGAWRGGASIMARAVLAAHNVTDRRVYVVDSFAGLPPPDADRFPADAGDRLHRFTELAVSRGQVEANFRRFDLLDEQVTFVEGWFRDTMPHFPAEKIAVLRLDGDMYESTFLPLQCLWDRVSEGGTIIIDDYHVMPACKLAVEDFARGQGHSFAIQEIDGLGVYFVK